MSFKKKILSVITSAACIMSCVCMFGNQANDQYTAEAVGLTGQSAFDITSQMVIGWNLGNSLDSTNDNLTMDSSPKKFAMHGEILNLLRNLLKQLKTEDSILLESLPHGISICILTNQQTLIKLMLSGWLM